MAFACACTQPNVDALTVTPTSQATAPSSEPVADELRAQYFRREHHDCRDLGRQAVTEHPDDARLHGWWLLCRSWIDRPADLAIEVDRFAAAHADDPWIDFTVAAGIVRGAVRPQEALERSARFLDASDDHPDAVWLRAMALSKAGRDSDAIAFLDRREQRGELAPSLLVLRAASTQWDPHAKSLPAQRRAKALADLANARRIDPDHAEACFMAAQIMDRRSDASEALSLLEQALRLAPSSGAIRGAYWSRYYEHGDKTLDERVQLVAADIEKTLAEYPDRLDLRYRARAAYGEIGLTEQKHRLGTEILDRYPNSTQAEHVQSERIVAQNRRSYRESPENKRNPEALSVYRRMAWEFLERPRHKVDNLLGDHYLLLFFSYEPGDPIDPALLLQLARGAAEHNKLNPQHTRARFPIAIVDRTPYAAEAEQLAQAGFAELDRYFESQRPYLEREGEYAQARASMEAQIHDAVGWAQWKGGKRTVGEASLRRALELSPGYPSALIHLAHVAIDANDLDEAERLLVLARQRSRTAEPTKLLEQVYVARHGHRRNIERYLGQIEQRDRERRRRAALESLVRNDNPLPEFSLSNLDGELVRSTELNGRVTVVHFWGVWCGWCVTELPEFQTLADKYAAADDVQILSIDVDDVPEQTRQWMAKRGYSFETLTDDGYAEQVGITAYPTTWFVDPDGKIRFEIPGANAHLLEEYEWRIDALRRRPTR